MLLFKYVSFFVINSGEDLCTTIGGQSMIIIIGSNSNIYFKLSFYLNVGEGGHDRISRHVRTPLYRLRSIISGFEIVLHGVILPQLPLFARAGRIYWLE